MMLGFLFVAVVTIGAVLFTTLRQLMGVLDNILIQLEALNKLGPMYWNSIYEATLEVTKTIERLDARKR
jgi:hypothetical protein